MSQDHLTALRLLSYYWLTIIMPSNTLTFNVAYNKEPSSSSSFQSSAFYQASRKFGGYRIVPRACKDALVDTSYKNDVETGSGVCMFNYECTQLGGTVVGSCVDVFLFGACCRLPAGVKVPTVEHSGSATAAAATTTTGRQPPSWSYSEQPPLSFQQPVADTILFHRNGSAVQNTYSPDDMSADLLANSSAALHANRRPPADMTDVVTEQQYTTSSADGQHYHRPPFAGSKITSKVDYGDGSGGSATTVKQTSPWSSWPSSSPVSKSTDSVPNIRKTTPSGTSVQATTSKQGYGGYVHAAPDDYYDNMVLVPTLTVQNDPNVKTPVENNSIHHILSILNHTPPTDADQHDVLHDRYQDQEHDPMETSPSYQHTSGATPSQSSSPALYTWGSIESDTKSPGYGGSSTFPSTKPSTAHHSSPYYTQQTSTTSAGYYGSSPTSTSTSTHHLPGPHFHVLSTTSKPAALDSAVPTVIVLSSANDSKYPNNKFSTSSLSSSYRPTPSSHVKPSQSIVVSGKPSISAAYTATYHHPVQHHHQQHQEQQNIAFVPVSSTTLADHYHNTNHHGVVHTSAKPLLSTYGSRPPSTTTVLPTFSSTVHHDNNVFTTVITSVNQQYHNKYQPTSTFTTAKPVLNDAGTAAILSPSGSYKPTASAVDDDYPSPVVTPATQVFITASDLHHHHHHLQHHTSSSSYPSTSSSAVAADDDATTLPFNSTDTFAFPPVRDPNVNLTAATQQEKPYVVPGSSGGIGGGGGSGVGGGDDYDTDADPNPQLTGDDNLDDKVHLFVEKVVQSLQGNFEDLEKVLLSGDTSSSNVSIGTFDDPVPTATGWPNKKPTTAPATTTKKPSKPTAGKPTKPPPNKVTVTSTYKPTPITLPLDAAPYLELTSTIRPTKIPTLLTPVQLFQPTTYATDNKRPTKQPVKVTQATTVVLDTLNVEHDHTTAEPDYRKTCGVRPLVRKNGRIVGGTGSTFGEWPWQVLVREATWLGLFTKNKCGGVLITQRHVITAAHCQPGFLANLVAVFGEYDISGEVESKRSISKNVKRVIVHRQYDAATFENDIALLELESPVSYDLHIVPICMPDDDDEFTGRMAVVTGWGRLKYGGGVPSILQEVQVPIIENQVCQDMFETAGHSKTILNSFLCAGYANGQRDSCEGDSGGPLMIEKDNGRWTLIGTVSHGIKCAAPYLPGVYMRTTYYKPWLQTITGVQ
ncbi:serine proteinase stubble-like [Sipha flava]|uniref:Serine proteinase stubble-like n=1 Tax=Sipha flava TaxID=143950 RepID=A0A8B8GGD4_9HEMI|nr:serine proteinase stubble-like [Sipha flava]